jgi:hypothetical protein
MGCGPPLLLPTAVIYGLLAAVLVSPANSSEYLPHSYTLTLNGSKIRLNDYWGKRAEYLQWFEQARSKGGGYAIKALGGSIVLRKP